MSHVDQGPLPSYNSLVDGHLNGYFTNTRMRRHLQKAGLITKRGEIVSENTYRLNMSRKEHKKHVKDMLAQAIVHKTLDLERTRQAEIKKKIEEIAKIELVRRVRAERNRPLDDSLLPFISPRASQPRVKAKKKLSAVSQKDTRRGYPRKEHHGSASTIHERASRQNRREQDILPLISPRTGSRSGSLRSSSSYTGKGRSRYKSRPVSAPSRKGRRPISALSSNYEDEDEAVVYLDDEGRPITPAHVDEAELKYSSKDPIDTRHLYSLDTSALRKYAMLMAKMEQGQGGLASPYLIPQVPLPPKSPKDGRTPRSSHRYRSGEVSKSCSPKRPSTANQAYLHPAGSAKRYRGQQETMCEVHMRYHGSNLSLAREQFDRRQDIMVEQQHCGGNTLTVFRDKLEPDTKFSFVSYRHRGYPFSLTIYIDGQMDCRVSTCCEYRHQKGGRIGGKKGHFSITKITGTIPCYKCQVEKGVKIRNQAPRPKLKRPPEQHEEVVVVETARKTPEPQPAEEKSEKQDTGKEILVSVEDVEDQKASDKYEDDFESSNSSSSESEQEEDYTYNNVYDNERGDNDSNEDDGSGRKKQTKEKLSSQQHEKIVRKKEKSESQKETKSKGRKKSSKSKKSRPDDHSDHSDSSCSENESYYEYKRRMMKKIQDEVGQSLRDSKDVRSDNKDKEEKTSLALMKEKERQEKSKLTRKEKGGKKKSSTSSAVGQAEPVKAQVTETVENDSVDAGAAGKNGRQSGARRGGSTQVDDTADEVSDIESEMAASPRKTDSVGNLLGPNFESDVGSNGFESSGRSNGSIRENVKENVKLEANDEVSKSESSINSSSKSSRDVSEGNEHYVEYKTKAASSGVKGQGLKEDKNYSEQEGRKQNKKVSSIWEEVLDNADGQEEGLQLDLNPQKSVERGNGTFDMEETKAETDFRGGCEEWSNNRKTQRSGHRGQSRERSGKEERTRLRGEKSMNDESLNNKDENKKRKGNGRMLKESKPRSRKSKDEFKNSQSFDDDVQNELMENDVVDAGAGFNNGDGGDFKSDETPPKFEGKIITIAMAKTGENKYLMKQAKEDAERRRKSEHNRENTRDKRKGRYFKDLSPPEKVIRGFVGDSCSDNNEDETYSKLLNFDQRASVSDSEPDFDQRKDYRLAKDEDANMSSKFHNTVELDENSIAVEETLQYNVFIDVELEREQKEKLEQWRRDRQRKEMEEKIKDDLRGETKRIRSRREKPHKKDGEVANSGSGEESVDLEIHPLLLLHKSRKSESIQKSQHECTDFEGVEEVRNGMAQSGRLASYQISQDSLMYRHTFTEEPMPKLFKPGIKDNHQIQSKHISGEYLSSGEDEALEKDNKCARETNDVSHVTKEPLFGDKVQLVDDTDVTVTTLDKKSDFPDSKRSEEDNWKTALIANDQSSEQFDAQAEIIGTRYVDNESDRYVKNPRAMNETPIVKDQDFLDSGQAVSILCSQDQVDSVPWKERDILPLSVNQPGERYNAEDIRSKELRRARRSPNGNANDANKGESSLKGTYRDTETEADNHSRTETVHSDESRCHDDIYRIPDGLVNGKELNKGDELNELVDLSSQASPSGKALSDLSEANQEEHVECLQEKTKEGEDGVSGFSNKKNDSEPTGEQEPAVIIGNRPSDSAETSEKLNQNSHRDQKPDSLTAFSVRDMWLGRSPSEDIDLFEKTMYKDNTKTGDWSDNRKKQEQVDNDNETIAEEEVTKLMQQRKGKKRAESITPKNLMSMWLGGEEATEAKSVAERAMNAVSDLDTSSEDLSGHLHTKKDDAEHNSGLGSVNINKQIHETKEPIQGKDVNDNSSVVSPTDPIQLECKNRKDSQTTEGETSPKRRLSLEDNYSDDFTDEDVKDSSRRKESNYMADVSSSSQMDSDSRPKDASMPDDETKKRRKGKKRTKAENKRMAHPEDTVDTVDGLTGSVEKESVLPAVVITNTDEERSKGERTSAKSNGNDDDDNKSYVSDASGIDALIECLEEQLSDSRRQRTQSESSFEYDKFQSGIQVQTIQETPEAENEGENEFGESQVKADEDKDLNQKINNQDCVDGLIVTEAFTVNQDSSLKADKNNDELTSSIHPVVKDTNEAEEKSLKHSLAASKMDEKDTKYNETHCKDDRIDNSNESAKYEKTSKDEMKVNDSHNESYNNTNVMDNLTEKNLAASAHTKLLDFMHSTESKSQNLTPDLNQNTSLKESSSYEFENISGEDEEDAARKYVSNILSRLQTEETDSPGTTAQKDSPNKTLLKDKVLPSNHIGSSQNKLLHDATLGFEVTEKGTNSQILLRSNSEQNVVAQSMDNSMLLEYVSKSPNQSMDNSMLLEYVSKSPREFKTEEKDSSRPSTDRSSSLINQGSEHAERRRQRKLTVSFAVDDHDDEEEEREKKAEIPWEEIDVDKKEDEYEKLERELQRSLVRDY